MVPGSPVAAQLLKERASSGSSRGMSTGSPLSPAAGFRGSPAGFAGGRRTSGHVPAAAAAVEAFRSPGPAGVRPRTLGSGSASGVRYRAESGLQVRLHGNQDMTSFVNTTGWKVARLVQWLRDLAVKVCGLRSCSRFNWLH